MHYVNNIPEMLIPYDEVNILNTFRVMIILRLLLLLTNLHLKLLSTQGTGADKLLSTQRVNHIARCLGGHIKVRVLTSSDFSTTVNSVTSCTLVALQWHIARVLLNFCGKYTVVAKRIRTFCYFIKKRTNECETAKQITKNS